MAVTTWAKRPSKWRMLALLTLSPKLAKGSSGFVLLRETSEVDEPVRGFHWRGSEGPGWEPARPEERERRKAEVLDGRWHTCSRHQDRGQRAPLHDTCTELLRAGLCDWRDLRARSTTASCLPRFHIGLGRRNPTSGSALHMYGVFGFAPNWAGECQTQNALRDVACCRRSGSIVRALSVNKDQKSVSRSRSK